MRENRIYHGSNVVVSKPTILINGHYKDFGYGFYCTDLEKQAKRWALTKKGASIVNQYLYTKNDDLDICVFEEMTPQWLLCNSYDTKVAIHYDEQVFPE